MDSWGTIDDGFERPHNILRLWHSEIEISSKYYVAVMVHWGHTVPVFTTLPVSSNGDDDMPRYWTCCNTLDLN